MRHVFTCPWSFVRRKLTVCWDIAGWNLAKGAHKLGGKQRVWSNLIVASRGVSWSLQAASEQNLAWFCLWTMWSYVVFEPFFNHLYGIPNVTLRHNMTVYAENLYSKAVLVIFPSHSCLPRLQLVCEQDEDDGLQSLVCLTCLKHIQ